MTRFDQSAQSKPAEASRYTLVSAAVGWAVVDGQTGGPAILRGRLLDGLTFSAAEEIYRSLLRLERRQGDRLR